MNRILALGLCATLSLAAPAGAQTANAVQQQGGPAVDGQTAYQAQVRAIEGSLRQSQQQLDTASVGSAPPNYEQARTAVRAGLALMARMPTQQQNGEAVQRAAAALRTAESGMEDRAADPRIVSANLRSAAEALAAVHGELSAAAPNAGPQQGSANPGRPGG